MLQPTQPATYKPRSTRASALLVVLWVIAFLSFLVITGMLVTSKEMESLAARKLVSRARQLAEMGVAVASHPKVNAGQGILTGKVSSLERYEARITSEEARLNLNAMLTEEHRGVLERLFQSWGMQPAAAQTLVNAMMDWVDADDMQRLNSAEKSKYLDLGLHGRPANRPFRSMEEVALVTGMDMLAMHQPNWRDSFTLWGKGRLDLNEASGELIAVAGGMPNGVAEMIVSHRNGADGLPHTKDDQPFKDIDDLEELLGMTEDDTEQLAKYITLESETKRIESLGYVGDKARGIIVILDKNSRTPTILEWREFAGK